MNKLLQVIKSSWLKVVAGIAAIVGLVALIISRKNQEIEELKVKLDLVDTQKKADVLETQIKEKLKESELVQRDIDSLEQALVVLEDKRKSLKEDSSLVNPEDYWSKN